MSCQDSFKYWQVMDAGQNFMNRNKATEVTWSDMSDAVSFHALPSYEVVPLLPRLSV